MAHARAAPHSSALDADAGRPVQRLPASPHALVGMRRSRMARTDGVASKRACPCVHAHSWPPRRRRGQCLRGPPWASRKSRDDRSRSAAPIWPLAGCLRLRLCRRVLARRAGNGRAARAQGRPQVLGRAVSATRHDGRIYASMPAAADERCIVTGPEPVVLGKKCSRFRAGPDAAEARRHVALW